MTGEGELVAAGAAEAAALRDRLAEIEAEQAALEAELAAFDADYVRIVVTVMAQFHEAEAKLLRLIASRSGAAGDERAARAAGERARETTAEVRAVPAPAPVPTGDVKKLFREAAKRMHPDLAPDGEARGHAEAFMKRLNAAYRAGDGEAIADLLRQWDASPYAAAGTTPDAHRAGALAAAVARAERRLAEVRESDLARLMEQAMAAAAEGRDLLAEMRTDALAALARTRARLSELEAES